MLAVWGVLGLIDGYGRLEGYSLGGRIGQDIVGTSTAVGILLVILIVIVGVFIITPKGFANLIAGLFGKLFSKRREQTLMASQMPLPQVQYGPSINLKPAVKEPDLKNSAFPRFKPEAKARPAYPVEGSKSWLWNRLHPQKEVAAPLSGSGMPNSAVIPSIDELIDPPTGDNSVDSKETGGLAEVKADTQNKDEKTKATSPKDMKQVAQEVWKKYGEAGTQTTADGWKLPPLEILDNVPEVEFSQADNIKKAKLDRRCPFQLRRGGQGSSDKRGADSNSIWCRTRLGQKDQRNQRKRQKR